MSISEGFLNMERVFAVAEGEGQVNALRYMIKLDKIKVQNALALIGQFAEDAEVDDIYRLEQIHRELDGFVKEVRKSMGRPDMGRLIG